MKNILEGPCFYKRGMNRISTTDILEDVDLWSNIMGHLRTRSTGFEVEVPYVGETSITSEDSKILDLVETGLKELGHKVKE